MRIPTGCICNLRSGLCPLHSSPSPSYSLSSTRDVLDMLERDGSCSPLASRWLSRFCFTSRAQWLCWRLASAWLLVFAILYGVATVGGNLMYSMGSAIADTPSAVAILREAGTINPLTWQTRGGSARRMIRVAHEQKRFGWYGAALIEVRRALELDPNSPDLLVNAGVFCALMGDEAAAEGYIQKFRRIARAWKP